MSAVLGLDVGGANLKAAHTDGTARSRPFALWKEPAALAERLRSLRGEFPAFDRLAVTMTGELCDCFATRREGVRHILNAVAAVVPPDTVDGRPATKAHAHARLARMLCGDAESVPRAKAVGLAKRLSRLQQNLLDAAARRVAAEHGPPETLILGGSGEFLARMAFAGHDGPVVSL